MRPCQSSTTHLPLTENIRNNNPKNTNNRNENTSITNRSPIAILIDDEEVDHHSLLHHHHHYHRMTRKNAFSVASPTEHCDKNNNSIPPSIPALNLLSSSSTKPQQKQKTRLNDFELLSIIGGGVEGQVYRAIERGTNQVYALKRTLCSDSKELEEQQKQLSQVILYSQQHSNICTHHEQFYTNFTNFAGETEYEHYVLMDECECGSLEDVIRRGEVPTFLIKTWLLQLCDALQFLHSHGLVHRDVKPDNCLFKIRKRKNSQAPSLTVNGVATSESEDTMYHRSILHMMKKKLNELERNSGESTPLLSELETSSIFDVNVNEQEQQRSHKQVDEAVVIANDSDDSLSIQGIPVHMLSLHLTDFGFMRDVIHNYSAMKSVRGTRLYMAPEIFESLPYNESVDMWSTGILLLQMLIGWNRWKQLMDTNNLHERILDETNFLFNLLNENPSVDQKLVAVVLQCCNRDDALRPTAEEVIEFLNDDTRTSFMQERTNYMNMMLKGDQVVWDRDVKKIPTLQNALMFWNDNFGAQELPNGVEWITFKRAYFRTYDKQMFNLFAQRGLMNELCTQSPNRVTKESLLYATKISGEFPFNPSHMMNVGQYGGGSDFLSHEIPLDSPVPEAQRNKARNKYLNLILQNKLIAPLFNKEVSIQMDSFLVKHLDEFCTSMSVDQRAEFDMEDHDEKVLRSWRLDRKFSLTSRKYSIVEQTLQVQQESKSPRPISPRVSPVNETESRWATSEDLNSYSLSQFKNSNDGDNALELLGDSPTQRTLVLGGSSSGKTVLLHTLLKEYAQKALDDDSAYIPIFVPIINLREITCSISFKKKIIQASADKLLHKNVDYSKEIEVMLMTAIDRGQVILLFDGLDAASSRADLNTQFEIMKVIETLEILAEGGVIISSRVLTSTFSTSDICTSFDVYKLMPLSQKLKQSIVYNQLGPTEAEQFLSKLNESQPLSDICAIPLFLTILIHSFQYTRMLPTNSSQVFDFAIKMFVETITVTKKLKNESNRSRRSWNIFSSSDSSQIKDIELTRDLCINFLSLFAEHMHATKKRYMDDDSICNWIKGYEWIDMIPIQVLAVWRRIKAEVDNESFGLIKRTKDRYSFGHICFQEHLASLVWANPNLPSLIRKARVVFKKKKKIRLSSRSLAAVLLEPYYRETIFMTARNMTIDDFVRCIKQMIEKSHSKLTINQSELVAVHSVLLQMVRRRSLEEQNSKQVHQLISSLASTKVLSKLMQGLVHPSSIMQESSFKKLRDPFVLTNYETMISDTIIQGLQNEMTCESALNSLNMISTEFLILGNLTAYHKLIQKLLDHMLERASNGFFADIYERALVIVLMRASHQYKNTRRYSGSGVVLKDLKAMLANSEELSRNLFDSTCPTNSTPLDSLDSIVNSTQQTLFEMVSSKNIAERVRSLSLLGKIGPSLDYKLSGVVMELVSNEHTVTSVRAQAILTLGQMMKRSTLSTGEHYRSITVNLVHKSSYVREAACIALRDLPIPLESESIVFDLLIQLLLDPVKRVRHEAYNTLCSLIDQLPSSIESTMKQLFDVSNFKRKIARIMALDAQSFGRVDNMRAYFMETLMRKAALSSKEAALSGLLCLDQQNDNFSEALDMNFFALLMDLASIQAPITDGDESVSMKRTAIKMIENLLMRAIQRSESTSQRYVFDDTHGLKQVIVKTLENLSSIVTGCFMSCSKLCAQALESMRNILDTNLSESQLMTKTNVASVVVDIAFQAETLLLNSSDVNVRIQCAEVCATLKMRYGQNHLEHVVLNTLNATALDPKLVRCICKIMGRICEISVLVDHLSQEHAKPYLFDSIMTHMRQRRIVLSKDLEKKLNHFKNIESYFLLLEAFATN